VYYTAIKRNGHLRIRGKCRRHEPHGTFHYILHYSSVLERPDCAKTIESKKEGHYWPTSRNIINFSFFQYKTKNHFHCSVCHVELNLRSFIRIHWKLVKAFDSKLSNFYKEMYARGQRLPSSIPFFVIITKFGVVSGEGNLFGKALHG